MNKSTAWIFVALIWRRKLIVISALTALGIASVARASDPITIDMIDVGTGLSLFVKGEDFSALYDAGSNDDAAQGTKNRVTAFLAVYHPNVTTIDHVILSHPHKDHLELLPDVFDKYDISDIWDTGAVNDTCGYGRYALAVKAEGAVFHTNRQADVSLTVRRCKPKGTVEVKFGPRIEKGTMITLGDGATMRILHVEHEGTDLNDNSVVVQMKLHGTTVLFMGDAEAGQRSRWADGSPQKETAEDRLLKCCTDKLASDILVAGHHGSRTSSRTDFLDAVGATTFLVSSGPKKYSGVTLPDQIVIDELERRGTVFRTDVDDAACKGRPAAEKIGRKGAAGGCTNIRVTIPSSGAPNVAVLPLPQ